MGGKSGFRQQFETSVLIMVRTHDGGKEILRAGSEANEGELQSEYMQRV